MPFWIIHSEDIINNTGITLANPTGVAGTYALAKDVVTQDGVILRHDLSWGGGTAQPVTEDGVYTLSDGSNTIEATVDYSELSIEDETDNVRIEKVSKRYWVNGPGNFYDPDHWSHESGGEGGLIGSPNDDDDIVIDENSFTARGQFINFKELV